MKKYINAERIVFVFVVLGLCLYIWFVPTHYQKNETETILKERIKTIEAQKDSLYKQVDVQSKNIKKSIQKIDSLKKQEVKTDKIIYINENKIKNIENAKPLADSALLDFFTKFKAKNK